MTEANKHFSDCVSVLLDSLNYPQLRIQSDDLNSDSIYTDIFNELSEIHLRPKFSSIKTISRITAPCIFLRKKSHPIVILRIEDNNVITYDPKKKKVESLKSFSLSDRLLNFEKIDDKEKILSEKTKHWTFHLVKKFTFIFAQASALCTITNLLAMATPIFILMIFSQINNQGTAPDLSYIIIGVVAYIIATFVFSIVKSYTISFIGARLSFLINTEYFKRTITAENKYSGIITLNKQIPQFAKISHISENFGTEIVERSFDIFYLILMTIIIFILAGKLALVPIITFLLFIAACSLYIPFTKKVNTLYSQNQQMVNDFLRESVLNLYTIRATNSETTWLNKGKKILYTRTLNNEKRNLYKQNSIILSNTAVQISTLLTIYFGVNMVIDKVIAVPTLMACVFFLWKALSPLKSILILTQKIKESLETSEAVDKFMDLEIEEDNLQLRQTIINIKYIILKGVTAKYNTGKSFALRGINLTIEPNETTLIYGKDGSGKNSIIKLILGILQPQIGNVFINDYNQTQFNQRELRKSISTTPPTKIPFNLTINELFGLYMDEKNDQKIYDILEDYDIKRLSSILDKTVDEWDFEPSTCELKRLSIAITFSKQSSVYILRDISKGLSYKGVTIIKDKLQQFKHKKTIILTSSEKIFVNKSDKVIHLREGKIDHIGTPAQFLTKKMKKRIK